MNPDIIELGHKTLIGIPMQMSVTDNQTPRLWSTFMPRLHEVEGRVNDEFISLQQFDPDYFRTFNPARKFTKWASVEVSQMDDVPVGMECFELPAGLYAIFHYKGLPGNPEIFQFIYGKWLPSSGYSLDDRPHFEVLGSKYRRDSAESEEDIYIPIK